MDHHCFCLPLWALLVSVHAGLEVRLGHLSFEVERAVYGPAITMALERFTEDMALQGDNITQHLNVR